MSGKSIPIIGILGGIGSGKSTVAREFGALGCGCVDADALGHELYERPDVLAALRARFGEGVCDPSGRVDRKKLGQAAFASPESLSALNEIMHPRIRQRIIEQIERLRNQAGWQAIVVDAALLLETDWHELCDVFVYVDAPQQERRGRVEAARAWDEETWRRRENSQKTLDIKKARAEYVIDNRFSDSCLHEQVRSVLQRILQDGGPSIESK